MRINFSSYSKPNPQNHKYISNIVLDKEEMAKLEQAINALKNMAENQATFQPNVYIPCNGFQAKIIQGILGNSLDEINYTEN
jgi:hypothetical protein